MKYRPAICATFARATKRWTCGVAFDPLSLTRWCHIVAWAKTLISPTALSLATTFQPCNCSFDDAIKSMWDAGIHSSAQDAEHNRFRADRLSIVSPTDLEASVDDLPANWKGSRAKLWRQLCQDQNSNTMTLLSKELVMPWNSPCPGNLSVNSFGHPLPTN